MATAQVALTSQPNEDLMAPLADLPDTFWTVDQDNWKIAEGKVRAKITPGTYQLIVQRGFSGMSVMLREMHFHADRLAALPGSLAHKIVGEVDKFWDSGDRYALMGTIHKRGLLLEGRPGSGKTAVCLMIGQEVAKRGGISIFTMPNTIISPLPEILQSIREIQPDMKIINIIEDIDRQSNAIDVLLPMLDGETQINNVLHLATTNYVEKLDDRLTNRPSRFDKIFTVGAPTKRARRAYLHMLMEKPLDHPNPTLRLVPERLEEMVSVGRGLMYAHLKELAQSVYILNEDPTKTAGRLRALAENGKKSGFSKDEDEDDN